MQVVLFDRSNNNGCIDVEMDGSVLEEKSSFKMLMLTFPSKVDWDSYIAKTVSQKIATLIHSMECLSFEVALYLYKFKPATKENTACVVVTCQNIV